MKKALLLSMIASTMIMAGGDIAPVESAVVTPVSVAESGWKFSGQGVVYYEADYHWGWNDNNLFDKESSFINTGLQLTATNDNLIGGIGFGVQLNGLGTLGLDEDVASYPMQTAGDTLNGAYISQLYLTYGMGNTSLKVGRQELPKALSPFAYSEDWNVFKNTFNAALVVNTDIPNTTLVGAWVKDANHNSSRDDSYYNFPYYASNMNEFNKVNGNDGIWMLTAQNRSIDNLTLTGSYYYVPNYSNNFFWMTPNKDLNILWADAQYDAGFANIGLQGGTIMCDAIDTDTKAFGAKISGKVFDVVNASLAYSHVNDSNLGIFQVGGTSSTLYTDTFADEEGTYNQRDNDKLVVRADADVLGGNISTAFAYMKLGDNASWGTGHVNEYDISYSTNITKDLNVAVSYYNIYDNWADPENDTFEAVRFVARYNF
jgi:hypothetical protein